MPQSSPKEQSAKKPPIVYVSGPITTGGNVPVNIRKGIQVAMTLRQRGFVVICPHERIVAEMLAPHDYEWWMENDFKEITVCDAVYRMSKNGTPIPSNGGEREVAFAKEHGIPVYYNTETLYAGFGL